jgi:hypothetical protein
MFRALVLVLFLTACNTTAAAPPTVTSPTVTKISWELGHLVTVGFGCKSEEAVLRLVEGDKAGKAVGAMLFNTLKAEGVCGFFLGPKGKMEVIGEVIELGIIYNDFTGNPTQVLKLELKSGDGGTFQFYTMQYTSDAEKARKIGYSI